MRGRTLSKLLAGTIFGLAISAGLACYSERSVQDGELLQVADVETDVLAEESGPVEKEVVLTGPSGPDINTLDNLAGKEVYVRKLSRCWPNLERLNARFKESGRPQIILKEADAKLDGEDILDMLDAGVFGTAVMDDLITDFWSKVHDGLRVHSNAVLAEGDQIGWAVVKNMTSDAPIRPLVRA